MRMVIVHVAASWPCLEEASPSGCKVGLPPVRLQVPELLCRMSHLGRISVISLHSLTPPYPHTLTLTSQWMCFGQGMFSVVKLYDRDWLIDVCEKNTHQKPYYISWEATFWRLWVEDSEWGLTDSLEQNEAQSACVELMHKGAELHANDIKSQKKDLRHLQKLSPGMWVNARHVNSTTL